LIDFEKYFDFEISYQNKSFTTLAGLILHQSGYIPNVGDAVVVEKLRLEVVDKDGAADRQGAGKPNLRSIPQYQ